MGEEKKERIVRAVLLFCALVVASISVYTTFMLFRAYEVDITFSPPENSKFSPTEEETKGTASFDIKQKKNGEEFVTEKIKPFEGKLQDSFKMPNPLVISEDLGRGKIVFVVVLIEVIIIGLIYWKLDGIIKEKFC